MENKYIKDFFYTIFDTTLIASGPDFVKSIPYEKRNFIDVNQQLKSTYIPSHINMPIWMKNFNTGHLGPYEKWLLLRILDRKNGIVTLRGGKRSGKSSIIKHLQMYAYDFLDANKDLKNEISLKNFIHIVSLDDSMIQKKYRSEKDLIKDETLKEKAYEELSLQIASALENSFCISSVNKEKEQQREYYYRLMFKELVGDFKSYCQIMEEKETVYPLSYSDIRDFIRAKHKVELDIAKFDYTRFSEAINSLPLNLRMIAKLLPYLYLGKKVTNILEIYNSMFVVVFDNLDQFPVILQNYIFEVFNDFFFAGAKDFGLSALLVLRHGTFVDLHNRFDNEDVIYFSSVPPAEVIVVLITNFLLDKDAFFEAYKKKVFLTAEQQDIIVSRALSLWFYLTDPVSDLYNSIDSISGTNIERAFKSTIEWLSSDNHPNYPFKNIPYMRFNNRILVNDKKNTDQYFDTVNEIVGHVSASNILYMYSQAIGRQIGSLIKKYFYDENNIPIYDINNKSILDELTNFIVHYSANIRLFKPNNKYLMSGYDDRFAAKRCYNSYKLLTFFRKLIGDNFKTTSINKHCINLVAWSINNYFDKKIDIQRFEYRNSFEKIANIIKSDLIISVNEKIQTKNLVCENVQLITTLTTIVVDSMSYLSVKQENTEILKDFNPIYLTLRTYDNNIRYIGVPDDNTYLNARFLISPFRANELLLTSSINEKKKSNNNKVINVFSINSDIELPIPLYILSYLNDSKLNFTTHYSALRDKLITLDFPADKIDNVVYSMLISENRLIYSSKYDSSVTQETVKHQPRDICLSWAGKLYVDKLIITPHYLETFLESLPYLQEKLSENIDINNFIMKRIQYAFLALKSLSNNEYHRYLNCKGSFIEYSDTTKLDTVYLRNKYSPICNILIESSYSFFKIINSIIHNLSKNDLDITKSLLDGWIAYLKEMNNNYSLLYEKTNKEWETNISWSEDIFDKITVKLN